MIYRLDAIWGHIYLQLRWVKMFCTNNSYSNTESSAKTIQTEIVQFKIHINDNSFIHVSS